MLAAVFSGPSWQALALAIATVSVSRAEIGALHKFLSAEGSLIGASNIAFKCFGSEMDKAFILRAGLVLSFDGDDDFAFFSAERIVASQLGSFDLEAFIHDRCLKTTGVGASFLFRDFL